jgi:alpha-L-fucosidase 2
MNAIKLSLICLSLAAAASPAAWCQPEPQHGLDFETPPLVWDEALPLGNGILGALVWGDGAPLKISLDRTDLWDLRPVPQFDSKNYSYATMRQWVSEGRLADLHALYDHPYGNAGPTKIPAGRIEISFGEPPAFADGGLDLAAALADYRFLDGPSVRILVHASRPVGLIEITNADRVDARLAAPPFAGEVKDPAAPNKISAGDLASLGYTPPREEGGDQWTGFFQQGWGGFAFAATLSWRRADGAWLGAWSIATSDESGDPLATALNRCTAALESGFEASLAEHLEWWRSYWNKSSIGIPNPVIERQWYLETYKFGAAARRGAPPITLQGPWTADNGKIPPWKGDYHHDLNTELCYWPCYSGNRLDEGFGFLDWLWKTRASGEDWTRRFFGMPGLNVPMTADLNGNQIGGWHQYTHSATTAAWLAHHFYLHWRYSMDRDFLRSRAYPYVHAAAVFLEAVTEKSSNGLRTLPLSSSPEINDNRLDAWFPSITNYDLALIRWTFATAAELAAELGAEKEAERWRGLLDEMPALSLDPGDGRLLVAKEYPLKESHRHFSHLMAIHPLGLVRWENGERDRRIISASLADLERLGTSLWTGYSFSWKACLASRARDGAAAEEALEIFSTAFCLRNSFHCNGDQSGKGYSRFRYRPFTLEGNFAAAAAIQEMLIQSHTGTIRIFPAIPESWKNASFRTLRAEGAFLVSASRRHGRVESIEILAEAEGPCRLENPFGGSFDTAGIEAAAVRAEDGEIVIDLDAGRKVVLSRR